MSGTNMSKYDLTLGKANNNPIYYNTTWGQKHWSDSTNKLTKNFKTEVLKP